MVLSIAVTVIVNSVYTYDVYPHFCVLCSVYVVAILVKDYFCRIILKLEG